MLAQSEVAAGEPCAPETAEPLRETVLMPSLGVGGRHEELDLHQLELADAEEEVPGRDFVAECLPDLRDPEGRLAASELGDVLEVDEDSLRGLGTEVRGRAAVL